MHVMGGRNYFVKYRRSRSLTDQISIASGLNSFVRAALQVVGTGADNFAPFLKQLHM